MHRLYYWHTTVERMTQTDGEQWLTIREIADKAGLAKSTVTRRRSAGDFPRAQLVNGTWKIPLTDLLEAGILDRVQADITDGESSATSDAVQLEKIQLESALALAQAERDRWKAVADERQETINALRIAVRALEPGTSDSAAGGHDAGDQERQEQAKKPVKQAKTGLWGRIFG